MRATSLCLVFVTLLCAAPAAAYDAEDPKNCNGVGWDDKSPWVIARVTATPRVNFVKSPCDADLKAESCAAPTEACQRRADLVTGHLVWVGRTQGACTCGKVQAPL